MKRFHPALGFLLIFGIFLLFGWRNFELLFQTDAAVGIDGYYYVLQVDSLRNTGKLYFATRTPLVLYFLTFLSLFTESSILAIKIGTLVLSFANGLGIICLVYNLTKNLWMAGLALILLMFSDVHLYFLGEFISNLGALTFLIWGAFGTAKGIAEKKNVWVLFGFLMLLFSCFSHRSAFWVLVSIGFVALVVFILLKHNTSQRSRVVISIGLLIGFALPCFLAWQDFFTLPYTLNNGIDGLFVRMSLVSWVFLAVAAPIPISGLFSHSRKLGFILLTMIFATLCLNLLIPFPVGLSPNYLVRREALIHRLSAVGEVLCDKPLVIAQHGEQFLASAVLKIPSQQKPPESARYGCVYWLIHENDTVILTEDSELREVFWTMNIDGQKLWIRNNPHLRTLLEKGERPN